MNMTVELLRNPNPLFAGVACIIAKGEPPEWLVQGLEHFSKDIGSNADVHPEFKITIERMQNAGNVLLKWLPIFEHLPFGIQCPSDVAVVMDALPRVKKDLDRLTDIERIGRRPIVRREICAAVTVEACKIIHVMAEPRSVQLQQACKEYWRACGGEQIGETDEIENWRWPAERALANNYQWVRQILLAVQDEY
jgi:hypothetical protein